MALVRCLLVLFVFWSFSTAQAAKDRKTITVGAYGFAPYYDLEKGRGIVSDVLDQLNSIQSDYQFKVLEIPSRRRYQSFVDHKVDMIFFEDPRWSWKEIPHYTIPTGIKDAEVYIATRKKAKDQTYFKSLADKRLAGILGYHYGFAQFNSNEDYLHSKFNIHLVSHNQASVRLVLHDRADVGVVPLSYIRKYMRENLEKFDRIIISDKVDQDYDLRIIVSPDAPIPRAQMEKLMSKLVKETSYKNLF
ncbi:hypothetical protein [Bdellovibrio sp. HCB209]|uniref:hypothetical protein n=1 Tax=Bdellovibrio sp. HCB209 TaxID=3394354 RepID=UPI0039B4435E